MEKCREKGSEGKGGKRGQGQFSAPHDEEVAQHLNNPRPQTAPRLTAGPQALCSRGLGHGILNVQLHREAS